MGSHGGREALGGPQEVVSAKWLQVNANAEQVLYFCVSVMETRLCGQSAPRAAWTPPTRKL